MLIAAGLSSLLGLLAVISVPGGLMFVAGACPQTRCAGLGIVSSD